MPASTTPKKLAIASISAVVLTLGCTLSDAPEAAAAVFALGDSASWKAGGTNALSNLGYNMERIADDPSIPSWLDDERTLSSLSSSKGTLSFSEGVYKAYVGYGWQTWSHGYTGEVYSNNGDNFLTIKLAKAIIAFDLFVQPNDYSVLPLAITALTRSGAKITLSQEVDGSGGAKYFGFYATEGDYISEIQIENTVGGIGFGMADFRLDAAESVPEPATVSGLLAFGALTAGWRAKRVKR